MIKTRKPRVVGLNRVVGVLSGGGCLVRVVQIFGLGEVRLVRLGVIRG